MSGVSVVLQALTAYNTLVAAAEKLGTSYSELVKDIETMPAKDMVTKYSVLADIERDKLRKK